MRETQPADECGSKHENNFPSNSYFLNKSQNVNQLDFYQLFACALRRIYRFSMLCNISICCDFYINFNYSILIEGNLRVTGRQPGRCEKDSHR